MATKKNVQGVITILTFQYGLGLLLIGSVITIIGFYIGYKIGMPKVKTLQQQYQEVTYIFLSLDKSNNSETEEFKSAKDNSIKI